MMLKSTVTFSLLRSYPTKQEMLIDLFALSKSQIKKMGLSKKYLISQANIREVVSIELRIVNHKKINPTYLGTRKIKLLEQTQNFIVLSKPSQIHSHPLSYDDSYNILSGMYELGLGKYLKVNSSEYDRGLLYRLDYETSGLILYAKKDELYITLRENFNSVVEKKEYLAVVKSGIQSKSYTHFIKPSGPKGHKMKEDESGDKVDIDVFVLEESEKFSLIKVSLKQGRRHQIRVQLALTGFPIVGDELYGGEHFDRLMLHCYRYQLKINQTIEEYQDDNFDKLDFFFADFNKLT